DPPCGRPDSRGARGARPRADPDPPPAPPLRSLAGAPDGTRRALGRCARQAPVPALRGRSDAAFASAHDRPVDRLPRRPALATFTAARLARAAQRGLGSDPVRRAPARADERFSRTQGPP